MRKAELVMASVLGIFSIYLMWKSAELPIGWIPEEGPGGGAFPFWLSAGMLICCVWIIVRGVRRSSPVAQSSATYMDAASLRLFLLIAGSLAVMLGLIHVVGVYVATPLFMLFYMRFMGGHGWMQTGLIAGLTPVVTFFFFEIALKITLPKGVTEPLFYPLYDIFF
ncbi:MAG: tripartite tricarboxylate transporter TctB family protein [Gammaproteobacteria bacterium]|nr:tripartite tricarboxylate transporter TctB family protein [Gammaproteobacteria bacterium]